MATDDFLSQLGRPVDSTPPNQQPITNPKTEIEKQAVPQDNFLQQYGKPVIGSGSTDTTSAPSWNGASALASGYMGAKRALGFDNPEEEEAYAKVRTPNSSIAEKTGEGAIFGAPFGPAGALSGAASSGVTEAMNRQYPNDPYFMNEGLGLLAGIAINPIMGAATQFGTKVGRTVPELFGKFQSPINKAYSDLGVDARIGGASSESAWPMQIQNALREGLGGSGIIRNQEDTIFSQIEQAAEKQAAKLAPDVTQQQLGEQIVSAAGQHGQQLKQWRENLYNALDALVPRQQQIDATNFRNQLGNLLNKYTGAPNLQGIAQQSRISNYMDAIRTDLANNNGVLPYSTLKNVRTDIGEMIEKGILEPGVDVKELRSLYAGLSRDLEGAYTSPQAKRAFQTVNAYAEQTYDKMQNLVQPLLAQNITPETIAQRMMAQVNKGATRIDDITSALDQADPTIKDTVLGYALRRLGEGPNGEFNPSRLWNNFNKLSPEFKALYPKEQQVGMDKLAQASGLIRDSFASRNTSGTTPTLHLLNQIGKVATGLTMTATGGILGAGAHAVAQNGMMDAGAGAAGLGLGYAMSPFVEAYANNLLARVWTNRGFNTWLGTQGLDKIPGNGTLGAVLAQAPNLLPFVDTVAKSTQLQPGEKGRGFLSGGVVSPMQSFPDQATGYIGGGAAGFPMPNAQPGYADGGKVGPLISANSNNPPMGNVTKLYNSEWDQLGVAMPFDKNPIIDQLIPPLFTVPKPANDFALGGLTDTRMPPDYPAGYSMGGKVGPDPRPFYNSSPSGWSKGFAGGGLSTSEIGYADGGLSQDKFSQAVNYLSQKTGVDPDVMKGAVKYMYKNESGLNEGIVNPTSKAFGIGQWLGPRKTELFSIHGSSPTYQNQLDFIAHELTGKEGAVLKALHNAKSEKEGYDVWGRLFERPGDAALAKAGVNYKPGNVTVYASNQQGNKNNQQQQEQPPILDQLLSQQEEEPEKDTETTANQPLLEAFMNAPWVNPETKLTATRILSES